MKTVILGEIPAAVSSLIVQRKRLGLDTHDEVWNGEYHMAPAANSRHGLVQGLLFGLLRARALEVGLHVSLEFNLGSQVDFRVPDLGVHSSPLTATWFDDARMVVEVLSPDDETFEKFDFYYDHAVEEILCVDPYANSATWFQRGPSAFETTPSSLLLGLSAKDVESILD